MTASSLRISILFRNGTTVVLGIRASRSSSCIIPVIGLAPTRHGSAEAESPTSSTWPFHQIWDSRSLSALGSSTEVGNFVGDGSDDIKK